MNKIQLFIEDTEIELNEDVIFALNKQFEEIENPTLIINDYSKTVEVPFTEKNNVTFGHLFRSDRLLVGNSPSSKIGINFDPTIKNDFRLIWNNEEIMLGYCKLNSITNQKGNGTYNITLFGSLGKVLSELQKITFDPEVAEPIDIKYVIDGSLYVNDYITKDLVKQSWESTGQSYIDLDDALNNDSWTSIYGFACNANNYNEEFDSKSVQNWDASNNKQTMNFTKILSNTSTFTNTHLDADSVVGDGLLPRQFCEFRSYYQQPYIYFNKLWLIFWKKAFTLPEISDYSLELDTDWFKNTNPYWKDTVFMLKPFEVKDGNNLNNEYYHNVSYYQTAANTTDFRTRSFQLSPIYGRSQLVKDIVENWESSLIWYKTDNDYEVVYTLSTIFNINCSSSKLQLKDGEWLKFKFNFRDTNNTILDTYTMYLIKEGNTPPADADAYISLEQANDWNVPINFSKTIHRYRYGNRFRVEFEQSFSHPLPYTINTITNYHLGQFNEFYEDSNFNALVQIKNKIKRSFSHFSLNDLWNNDYNLFDSIINYCRMFRLYLTVDDFHKKIKVQKLSNYFSNYTIEDWSNKIDFSQDFVITPMNWENKYVLFNYKDNDSKRNKKYKDKFGVNYGELKLATDYNFNNESKNLIEKPINMSMNATENILLWPDMYHGTIIYRFTNEIYTSVANEDGKYADNFGSLYFRLGLGRFEFADESEPDFQRKVSITDDTDYQMANNTYCYLDIWKNASYEAKYSTNVLTYPILSVIDNNDNLILWNKPKESYEIRSYNNAESIYEKYWKNYLNERYSVQNKKIECYARLTPKDYINFDFNKFITIDNTLYAVNKIKDFSIGKNEYTKIELIQISDVSAYTD